MVRLLHLNLSFLDCRTRRVILAFAWISGLFLGSLISLAADNILSSTMLAAAHSGMSISGLLAVLLLPLLFSALAVYISKPIFLIPIVFLKAFLFSFSAAGFLIACDSAAWLFCFLMMFSDTLMLPFLWWFWIISLTLESRTAIRGAVICTVCAFVIGFCDYFFVSPFLAGLI